MNNGWINSSINCLAINSDNNIFVGTDDVIYRSTDSGENWSKINFDIGYIGIYSIAFNSDAEIFAGMSIGAFHSSDNGETWKELKIGLEYMFVDCIAVNAASWTPGLSS